MRKVGFLTGFCLSVLYGCAQSVNLLATKVSAAAGSLLYVGTNGMLIPLSPPASGTSILSFSNGQYSFIALPAKGDTGPKGDKGDAGTLILPAANEGDVLVYINGQWTGTPATFNIDVTDTTATTTIILASKMAVKGGAYWLGGYLNIRQTDNTGTVTLQYNYTDASGNNISRAFPAMQGLGNSQFNPVVINCKAGSLITISTAFTNPAMRVVYDAGDVLHELK